MLHDVVADACRLGAPSRLRARDQRSLRARTRAAVRLRSHSRPRKSRRNRSHRNGHANLRSPRHRQHARHSRRHSADSGQRTRQILAQAPDGRLGSGARRRRTWNQRRLPPSRESVSPCASATTASSLISPLPRPQANLASCCNFRALRSMSTIPQTCSIFSRTPAKPAPRTCFARWALDSRFLASGTERLVSKPRRSASDTWRATEHDQTEPTANLRANSASSRSPSPTKSSPAIRSPTNCCNRLRARPLAIRTRRHPRRQTQNRFQGRRPPRRSRHHQTLRRFHRVGEKIQSRCPRHRTRPARKPRRHPPQERRAHHRDASRFYLRQQRRRRFERRRRPPRSASSRRSRSLRSQTSSRTQEAHRPRHSGPHHRHIRPSLARRPGRFLHRHRRHESRCATIAAAAIRTAIHLHASLEAVADELACAAGLVCGKLNRTPACIVRGFPYEPGRGRTRDLLRPAASDLFR